MFGLDWSTSILHIALLGQALLGKTIMFGVKYNLILLVKDLLGGVGGLLLLLYQTGTEAGLLVLPYLVQMKSVGLSVEKLG